MLENKCIQRNKRGKALGNQGFTLMEMIIVIAIIAVLIGLAAVGMSGYYRTSDQMRRAEVAETAFYSLQSHVNYLERQGKLFQFHDEILSYNRTVYGQDNILSEAQNRTIIELNYDGENAASFYAEEYYPDHRDSRIVCIRLDKEQDNREENPVYGILAASLQDEEVMGGSFLIEYDMSTGVVRGVFYSEDAESLAYHFAGNAAASTGDATDCVLRDAESLYGKRQGFYGLTYTAAGYAREVYETASLFLPDKLELVNGDRLYLTWREANTENPSFANGTFRMEEIRYLVTLYNQDDEVVAVYNLKRGDLYSDASGTQKGALNYLDDFAAPVPDTLSGSTKTARAGYADLSYGDSPDGKSGQYYFLLLECLDHPFLENGYDFRGGDTIHASLSIAYGGENLPGGEESVASNTESAFYAHVENGEGEAEYGIGCARHLWNVRNGFNDGDYRLVDDIDWADIEGRARDISFTSTQFADRETMGLYWDFAGTFTGEKPAGEAQGPYSHYRINGLSIREEGIGKVGLFAVNMGSISKVVFTESWVKGTTEVGTAAGLNQGSIEDVCVLEGSVTGESRAGGLTGSNEGTITGCTVTTGSHLISANHTVGGVAGYASGPVTDSRAAVRVEAVVPEGTEKISTSLTGRYVGGVIGYLEKGVTAENLCSGVLLDAESGMPVPESEAGRAGTVRECSLVTGIQYVGGVIGDIERGAGTYTKLYNYAGLGVTYVSEEERAARKDTTTRIYQYFGGITGMVREGNGLTGCVNYAPVAVTFVKDGKPIEEDLYAYIDNYPANNYYWNMPWYIGGIAGTNKGTVTDCYSLCSGYGSFAEEAESYNKVIARQDKNYTGCVVGGLIGSNEGTLLFTADLPMDTMQVVVKAFIGYCGGLVGSTETGVIRNEKGLLKVQGVVAQQGNSRPQNSMDYIGGIAGRITGGEFTGSYINDAYVMGKTAGGITGYIVKGMTLENCANTGIVYGRGRAIGGIAAFNYGTLRDCTNTGTVTTDKAISDIPAKNGTTYIYGEVGGVAGHNTGLIENCHSRQNADGSNYIVASNLCATGGLVGVNIYDGKSLFGEIVHDGVETVDVPIIIGGTNRFNYGTKVGGIVGIITGPLELKDFTYSGKIEVRCTQSQFSPGIGGIAGSMGVGASLAGCTMSGEIFSNTADTGGLVGYMAGGVIDDTNQVTKEAVIKGTSSTGGVVGYHYVSDASSHVDIMENKATVSGTNYVGGLAGYVDVGGTFDLSGRKNSGSVSGVQYVGGLVGGYRFTKLTEITDCENTGEVAGKTGVGGIAGYLLSPDNGIDHTLYRAVNRGRVLANQASSSSVGGVVGFCTCQITIKECRNEGEIRPADENCSLNYAGGIMGRGENNSIHMQSCSNMANIIADRKSVV